MTESGSPLSLDTSSTVYSLQGLVLKFDTLESIQPYLDQLEQVPDLREVRFGGNTLGVEACEGVAKVLENKKSLQVRGIPLVLNLSQST